MLDAGSAREDGVSRAVWQGLEFVRYLLGSRWLGAPTAQAAQAAPAAPAAPPSHAAAANAPQFALHVAKLSDLASWVTELGLRDEAYLGPLRDVHGLQKRLHEEATLAKAAHEGLLLWSMGSKRRSARATPKGRR